MSGTSLDGLDIALIEQGAAVNLIATHYTPMPQTLRAELLSLCAGARMRLPVQRWPSSIGLPSPLKAFNTLLDQQNLKPQDIRAIGSHGQTIRHEPARGFTGADRKPGLARLS